MNGLIAHEYGHHVTYRALRVSTLADQRTLIRALDEEFGLGGYLVAQFRRNPDVKAVVDAWLADWAHNTTVARRVSRYAMKNHQEFFAEIWAEYSTSTFMARSPVRRIGEILRTMTERSDVVVR